MKPATSPLAQASLALPAWLYGRLADLRNRFYDRPTARRQGALPVISVGNITAGGTGKTPTVAWIAARLLADGARPAVVSRGYGGTAGRGPRVVSRGAGALCGPAVCGDEPYQLAGQLPGVRIIVGSDRVAGVRAAREAGADVAILDDGFQHRRLARDLDIVLLDSSDPFGGGRMLPAGTLREPLAGLGRADLIVITRALPGQRHPAIEQVVRQHNRAAPLLLAGHRGVGFRDAAGAEVEAPQRAVAFCGIGNPGRFREDLADRGVHVVEFHARGDHQPYSGAELADLARRAATQDAVLLTTEKDLARLGPTPASGRPGVPLLAYRIEAVFHDAAPLLELLRRVTSSAAA